ncbi:lipid kinase YegS [Stappia sp. F7233]|uniref:Lipid kinase YegS n=1 Tax=Stappia albiluteola TaxID=2758565 RepID=A0A839AFM7_9HYPH|nr:lipid kinase YegS [Stappia albiluteola]MBA5777692.1 lipid kinase YegS [Stappia albiluteola]
MSQRRNLFLILHGKAAQRDDLRDAVARLRAKGVGIEVRVTFEEGDSRRLTGEGIRLAEEGRIDTIVAGGGDGTLNEVIGAALAKSAAPPCSFGLVPLGTANDFAHGTGIPLASPYAALRLCVESEPVPLDVGEADRRLFVNLMTGGAGTRVTVETDPVMKKLMGGAAYIFTGVSRIGELRPSAGSFKADDFSWEGEFLAMAIGNGRMAGGGIELCPQARPDDGLLDLMILPALTGADILETLSAITRNGLGELQNRIVRAQAPEFRVESEEPLDVNFDGEPAAERVFDVKVRPGAVRFHLPRAKS